MLDVARRRLRIVATAALVALSAALLVPPAATPAPRADVAGLQHLGTAQATERLQILRFRTPALAEDTEVRVLLPEGYDPSGATRYPVLYLLHGAGLGASAWTTEIDAEAVTAGYPLIIVMPSGGVFGFYADWWNLGTGGVPQWETYHLSQLLPWVDANYPTIANRDGRAVAGLSMGGLGALHYAAKRPDLFTAAASFSGAIDTNVFVAPPVIEVATMADGLRVPAGVFGPRATEEIRWRGHNPVDLAENLRGLQLTLDVGVGDAGGPGGGVDVVEKTMRAMNANMHNRLFAFGIDHRWTEYGPGCHCWWFWKRSLAGALPELMHRFANPAPPPTPFAYNSIDASYGVYGWHVAIDRPATEFSRLADAGPTGFTLTGSGAAVVTTAPVVDPGQVVQVTTQDARGEHVEELTADGEGRLTVPVSLGPGNPLQQSSPLGYVWAQTQPGPGWPSVTAHVFWV